MAPGLIAGSGTRSTPGGRMLEILTRLMLPMPAASRALSKALSGVEPSAFPAVPAALVTGVQPIQSSFAPARLAAFAARGPSRISLIVATRPRNASKKLPAETKSGGRGARRAPPAPLRSHREDTGGPLFSCNAPKIAPQRTKFCPKIFSAEATSGRRGRVQALARHLL